MLVTVELLIMKWIIVASAFAAIVSLVPAYAQQGAPTVSGTCASIGYSTSCCPRGGNCQASGGTCNCDDACYSVMPNDCCSDVACPRSKLLFLIMPAMSLTANIGTTIIFL